MKTLMNLSIGQRIGVGFAAIVAMAVVVGGIGVVRLSAIADELVLIENDRLPAARHASVIADNLNQAAQVLRNALIFDEPAQVAAMLKLAQDKIDRMNESIDKLTATTISDEGKRRLAAVVAGRDAFVPAKNRFVELLAAGRKAEATSLLIRQMRPDQLAYKQAIDQLHDYQIELIAVAAQDGEASFVRARTLMLGMLGLMVGLAAWVSWRSARSISEPLAQAVGIAERVAAGDLTSQVRTTSTNEIGVLFSALKKMNDSLVDVVGNVRVSADSIATGSSQIATGNADLSQRTEQQAGNLQRTAAAMEELTATVQQNSEIARQASQMAVSAGEAAARGGAVVGQVVGTMQDISASSKKIADIIGVIDGIAFQTNILALNAAVEAARAGEQGRGFAVVAGEVRNLAQRSAIAAKEIKSLIDASVDKVETGARLADDAGQSMDDIVGQVKSVGSLIAAISEASVEQSQGIGQIGDAVQQLDQVTQQNAALVEQSAAAADSLRGQANQLVSTVAMFTLDTARVDVRAAG